MNTFYLLLIKRIPLPCYKSNFCIAQKCILQINFPA